MHEKLKTFEQHLLQKWTDLSGMSVEEVSRVHTPGCMLHTSVLPTLQGFIFAVCNALSLTPASPFPQLEEFRAHKAAGGGTGAAGGVEVEAESQQVAAQAKEIDALKVAFRKYDTCL